MLRQSLEVSGADQASRGPAVLSGHRAVGTLLRVNACPAEPPLESFPPSTDVAALPLAGPGVLVTAVAHDAVALRQRLALQHFYL